MERHRGGWWVAGLIVLVGLMAALLECRSRPIEPDEMYGLFTAAQPTAAAVVRTQLTAPISLDPPTYQLLSHWTIAVTGPNIWGARLPAIVGFALMQVGLFVFVRRLGGVRAGWFAAAFPLMTYSFHYAANGRPYGWLLGMHAVALACWQGAARKGDAGEPGRGWLLVGLALALVAAITSHFFGILILIPVCAAEGARWLQRRKLDMPMLAALGAGVVAVGTLLPFKKAVAVYRVHYYTTMPGVRTISLAYRRLFLEYPASWGLGMQRNALIAMTVLMLAAFYAAWRRFKTRPAGEPVAEWVAMAALAALPFFGFVFAVVVTKTIEVRYVMPAVLGVTMLLALGLRPVLQSRAGMLAALGVVAVVAAVAFAGAEANDRSAQATLAAEMARTGTGDAPLYMADMGKFVVHWYYADAGLRRRLTYVYSQEREVTLMRHDVNYLTAIYMVRMDATVQAIPYEEFVERSHAGTTAVLFPHSGWDWMPQELALRGARLTPLGDALGGELEGVVIHP